MVNNSPEAVEIFRVYEHPSKAGLHRDFHHVLGWGTVAEVLKPYDERAHKEAIDHYTVTVYADPQDDPVKVEALPWPKDLMALEDEDLTRSIIQKGVLKIMWGDSNIDDTVDSCHDKSQIEVPKDFPICPGCTNKGCASQVVRARTSKYEAIRRAGERVDELFESADCAGEIIEIVESEAGCGKKYVKKCGHPNREAIEASFG